jgi:hypothetical protein
MVITSVGGGSLASQVSNSGATTIVPQATPTTGSFTTAAQAVSSAPSSTLQLSALATQLISSEAILTQKENTLSRSQLATLATDTFNQLQGTPYAANRAAYDAQVPNTDDPQLLALAKQATLFDASLATAKGSVANPFAGLSDQQLQAVTYDDSGQYTVNERRAADRESYDREETWRVQVVAQAQQEYNSTGNLTDFFMAVLEHYESMSPIQQATYPANYADDLESKIQSNYNYRTNTSDVGGLVASSLISSVLPQTPPNS